MLEGDVAATMVSEVKSPGDDENFSAIVVPAPPARMTRHARATIADAAVEV
jgi:hypothetical protein